MIGFGLHSAMGAGDASRGAVAKGCGAKGCGRWRGVVGKRVCP